MTQSIMLSSERRIESVKGGPFQQLNNMLVTFKKNVIELVVVIEVSVI